MVSEAEALRRMRVGAVVTLFTGGFWLGALVFLAIFLTYGDVTWATVGGVMLAVAVAAWYLFTYRRFYLGAKALESAWPGAWVIRLGTLVYLLLPAVAAVILMDARVGYLAVISALLVGFIMVFVVGSWAMYKRYGVKDFDIAFQLFIFLILIGIVAGVVEVSTPTAPFAFGNRVAIALRPVSVLIGIIAIVIWYRAMGRAASTLATSDMAQ